jgi:hypothetical protein
MPALAQVVTGPPTTFQSGPEDPTPTNNPTPTFTFSSTDPLATFECAVDSSEPASCASPYTTAVLADGAYTLSVRAVDALSNPGDWANRSFTVDTTGPETVIVTAPPAQTTERTFRIEFVSLEANVTFECSVDGGGFVPCSSPWTTPSLALGPHRVEVRALDALGNPDSSPALAEFTVAAPPPPPSPPPPPPAVLNVDAGVKELAGSLVADLDRAARTLATTEMRTILRRGGVTVRRMSALVPGTLTIRASAPARGSTKTVLTGRHSFATAATAPLVLKPTRAGRAMMTRFATIPLLVRARFITADGLSLSANREAQLVRDYLTAAEAKRAVARRLAGLEGARVKSLAVEVMRRCASNCLRVQASWIAKQRRWTAAGRARQVEGRLLARLGAIVSARH